MVFSVNGFVVLMAILHIMFIQGDNGNKLLNAARDGDKDVVEQLLKEKPDLVNYKNSVKRTELKTISYPSFFIRRVYSLFDPAS